MKQFSKWLMGHMLPICLVLLSTLLLVDVFGLINLFHGTLNDFDCAGLCIGIIAAIAYLILLLLAIRQKIWGQSFAKIWHELDKLYFHGFKVRRYLGDETISRLQKWLGCGICHELSVLAMLVLKNNKTAVLCHGDYYDADGNFKTHHSWVEFKIPLNGWWVADFSWIDIGFVSKKKYSKSDDGELKLIWGCGYDDFWDLPFSNALYEAIKSPKTSKVLLELTAFYGPTIEDGGFKEWCYSGQELRYTDGTFMIPFYNSEGKPISSRILRDFVKNPKRKQPKAKSVRLTRRVIRDYSIWRSQQKIAYPESSQ